jgi:hypothetical protein
MRYMLLAMLVFVALLGAATGMEGLGVGHPMWMVAIAGGLGGLGGAVILELLKAARG